MTVDAVPGEGIDFMPETEVEEVIQNVRMIVGIWRGEVVLDRALGLDASLLDAPLPLVKARTLADLAKTISEFEPRARLKAIDMEPEPLAGKTAPTLTIEIAEGG